MKTAYLWERILKKDTLLTFIFDFVKIIKDKEQEKIIFPRFSGSSTTGIAANLLNRKFIGIEKESEFIDISIKRKIELEKSFQAISSKIRDLCILKDMF